MTTISSDKVESEKRKLAREQDAAINDLFDDMYKKRRRIYRMNFVRGLFFGLGSALGGTVVVGLVLWVLSWFVDWPFVDQIIKSIKK